MTRPLDVTVVSAFGVMGGAERWLLRLLDATDRVRVRAILFGGGPFEDELRARGIPAAHLPVGRRPIDVLASIPRLAAMLRREPPEVLLANGVKSAAVAVPAGRLVGVPVVWAKHDHSYDRTLARPLASLADRVVAAAAELGAPTGRADTVVVPPPRADVEPAGAVEARSFWASRGLVLDGARSIVIAGRLVVNKGIDDAILALARPGGQGWRLVVVGPDDPSSPGERTRLERVAEERGVADRVTFAGPVENVAHWLGAFDALAVLTKPHPGGFGVEGFGTSAFEAMEAGIPVVAVGGGAVAARLVSGGGITVPAADPDAIARALEELTDDEARARAGRAAAAAVAGHPTATECADALVRVLAEAAVRPGAGLAGGPDLSVIATVLNDAPALDGLLAALAPQLRARDEVVISDGGSTDGSAEVASAWVRRDHRIALVPAPGRNIAGGRNAAVAAAKHPAIACTDAGCVPAPGWLDGLRAALAESDPADLIAGVFRTVEGTPMRSALAVAADPDPDESRRPTPLVRTYGRFLGRRFDPSRPFGRSMAFTRSAWEAAGGFPEHLATAEDPAFGRAVRAAGLRSVLSVDAEVAWAPRSSLGATARMYYRYGEGDAASGDDAVIGRNLVRAIAYLAAPVLLRRGGRLGRSLVGAGVAAALSLPVRRALRRPRPLSVAGLVPLVLAVKDLAKAAGCLAGLARLSRSAGAGASRAPRASGPSAGSA